MKPRTLAKQFGCEVTQLAPDVVMKWGSKVRRNEEAAMRLVQQHAPSVPIPHLYTSWYGPDQHGNRIGQLSMSFAPGKRLDSVLNNAAKERVCRHIWSLIAQIRTIPKPPHLKSFFCCNADGSPSWDPLLGGCAHPAPPLPSDAAVRERIFDEYVKCNGLSYADGKDLPNMLPRSDKSVFTHGDIAPRNILVDKDSRILALLDWENAGWYPDYWEYANLMKLSGDSDWKAWMGHTRPEPWDITGINKARRVLF
ncbi:hypothetical protein VTI74DRAFT_8468 [Chaetomium olivicolor]